MNSSRFTGPTRGQRRSLIPRHVSSLAGDPIACPITSCNTLVYPSFAANGEVEYRCVVGNHGQIATVVNGRVVLKVCTIISPRPRVLARRSKCRYPGCTNRRNKECGWDFCLGHCLEKIDSCGGYAHDYARARAAAREARARESLEVHPRTPLFLPSPSPVPPSSPIAGVDFDINSAYVQLEFTDRDLTVEAVCTVTYDIIDLSVQSLRVREILHLHQIKPASLEYRDTNGRWYRTAGRAVPVHYGQLYLRARSIDRLRSFPPAYYIDMEPRVRRFFTLVDDNVARDEAFQIAFDCEPTAGDHDSLKLCNEVLEKSPRHVRERFERAGRSPRGTWSEFVHTCFDNERARATTPSTDAGSSPVANARPVWRGPPAAEASSSRSSRSTHSTRSPRPALVSPSYQQNASPPPMDLISDSE